MRISREEVRGLLTALVFRTPKLEDPEELLEEAFLEVNLRWKDRTEEERFRLGLYLAPEATSSSAQKALFAETIRRVRDLDWVFRGDSVLRPGHGSLFSRSYKAAKGEAPVLPVLSIWAEAKRRF